jgi:hypothetical protein
MGNDGWMHSDRDNLMAIFSEVKHKQDGMLPWHELHEA